MKWLAAASLLAAAAVSPARPTTPERLNAEVVALARQMAANATAMRPDLNARLIPDTDRVVYVSNGAPITGHEYLRTLHASYAGRRHQEQRWTRWEVTPIGRDAAAFTGWATMTEVSLGGETTVQHVIVTAVFARTAHGWQRILAQKALLDEG